MLLSLDGKKRVSRPSSTSTHTLQIPPHGIMTLDKISLQKVLKKGTLSKTIRVHHIYKRAAVLSLELLTSQILKLEHGMNKLFKRTWLKKQELTDGCMILESMFLLMQRHRMVKTQLISIMTIQVNGLKLENLPFKKRILPISRNLILFHGWDQELQPALKIQNFSGWVINFLTLINMMACGQASLQD